jgi:7-keto-8-aminopelargonate synthetase-like enzyme
MLNVTRVIASRLTPTRDLCHLKAEACMSFDLAARLAARRAENLYRQRPLLESPQGPEVVVDGQPLLAFCNNDYLGWPITRKVIEAWRAGASSAGASVAGLRIW